MGRFEKLTVAAEGTNIGNDVVEADLANTSPFLAPLELFSLLTFMLVSEVDCTIIKNVMNCLKGLLSLIDYRYLYYY